MLDRVLALKLDEYPIPSHVPPVPATKQMKKQTDKKREGAGDIHTSHISTTFVAGGEETTKRRKRYAISSLLTPLVERIENARDARI